MKKMVFGAAMVLTFFLGFTAFADYVINLKNGGSVKTTSYWKEKDEVKFQYQGGVASLPSKNILSIVKVEAESSESIKKQKEQLPTAGEIAVETKKVPALEVPKAAPVEVSKESDIQEKEQKKEVDPEFYKKQKAYYMEQYEQAYQRYLEATSRRDQEAKKKAWEEFNRFGGKVVSLETELREKNNGVLPQWWKEQLH
jgi:hypothetical protein